MKPTDPKCWDSRYRAGETPWDFRGVPSGLLAFLQTTATPGCVLIPGCGSGYEVRAFHERGWETLAIDYSAAAIERARQILGPLAEKTLAADFFTHDFAGRKFDVIYERTFLCSLPTNRWPAYAQRMAELLRPGGRLISFFLYGHEEKPPPYPLTETTARQLFGRNFARVTDEPVVDSLPLFAGRERWQIWGLQT
jgi:SAM-dependent methyltransferase